MLNCGAQMGSAGSRLGIGRTAAVRGLGGWKAGAQSVGVPGLSSEVLADYCMCRSGCAQNGGEQTAGAGGGRGTPGLGRGVRQPC